MAPFMVHALQCLRRSLNLSLKHHSLQNQLSTFIRVPVINPIVREHLRLQNVALYSQNSGGTATGEKKKPKKSSTYVKITLLETDGNVKVTSLEEADKVAKRRDLKLVKIADKELKSERPLYKLMTKAQVLEEDFAQKKIIKEKKQSEIKDVKLLSISDKIGKNDLQSKIKNIVKWLSKKYEVRIVLSGNDAELTEKVFQTIESSVPEYGKLVQKRIKGKDVKFSILPIIKKLEEDVVDNGPK